MKNGKLLELIRSGKISDLSIGELEYLNRLSNREIDALLSIKQEFKTDVMANLNKKDFINEEDYYFILSLINRLNSNFNKHSFFTMIKNETLQSSKYYREIIEKLIETNGAGYLLFTSILEDKETSELEHIDDIIRILLESSKEKLSLLSDKKHNRETFKTFILNKDLLTNKDKYLTAIRMYMSLEVSLTDYTVIEIITNKTLIEKDNYIELLNWMKNWSKQNSNPLKTFNTFLNHSSKEEIETFLYKYHTLDYFIKSNSAYSFELYLKVFTHEIEKLLAKDHIEFSIKFFDTFIKDFRLFESFIEIATAKDTKALFTRHKRKYKEIIDITKRIKDEEILNAYVSVALSYRVLESKHWRYILNIVANTKESELAYLLAGFFNHTELLKREDLRSITALALNCEDRILQKAFFNIAPYPRLLERKDYIEIMKLTFGVSKNSLNEYTNLAISKRYENYPHLYKILKHATSIDDEERLKTYTRIAKALSCLPLEKKVLDDILNVAANTKDKKLLEAYDYALDNIETSYSCQTIDESRAKFCINTIISQKDSPNLEYLIYMIGDRDILGKEDFEEIINEFIKKTTYVETDRDVIPEHISNIYTERARLLCDICNTSLGASYIKEALTIERIYDLDILSKVFWKLNTELFYQNKPNFISKLINAIKSKEKGDLYFILEALALEDLPVPANNACFKVLYQTGTESISVFIDNFIEEMKNINDCSYDNFINILRSRKRNIKKQMLLSMLESLNPEEELDISEIENMLSLKPRA